MKPFQSASFRHILILALMISYTWDVQAQDTATYKLRLNVPLVDFPQNRDLPYKYPSMDQSLKLAEDFYDLGFWGIDALGNWIFLSEETTLRKISNKTFQYVLGLAFSKYGSELPIPLGVWAHEEFHRSVLGVAGIDSKNGNWMFNRWGGTVYGVSDEAMSTLKSKDPDQLLYSYVAGVHSEILMNREITLNDLYNERTFYKNSLLLYNAWYVYDYFRFSTGYQSDSVKVIAPEYEDADPSQRDFAGADLTAWAYDMFNPQLPYSSRDNFPNGNGENRRVGFSDLSGEAQEYLKEQKDLSLLNFINPAIFFVNRIQLGDNLRFNLFAQYAPTHFGHDISVYLPVKYKKYNVLLALHNYQSFHLSGYGLEIGIAQLPVSERMRIHSTLQVWDQPESFFSANTFLGGSATLGLDYRLNARFSGCLSVSGKTRGFQMGNPYLKQNIGLQLGLKYDLKG